MDEPRRNDVFDRELRRALAAEGGAAAGPHVDAELAAAWMDRQLDPVAARTIEAHLAGCHECQILLATLARLAPAEAPGAEGLAWWRRLRAGWLVPATVAAAAALVIWVAVPQQRAPSTPADQLQARADRSVEPPP
ncbi:MAG TPA: zf-HC2 domain-containing protein, partial [Vicinamibacterales bacterium]|nr:zf-HC2 domain-containing protein [Vicinamibacterales bacterium]